MIKTVQISNKVKSQFKEETDLIQLFHYLWVKIKNIIIRHII
jgi:hypothetical protein